MSNARGIVNSVPVVDNAAMLKRLLSKIGRRLAGKPFPGSEQYWIERYESGRNSGAGSYNELAAFKAEIINDFVARHAVDSVIEFGCGDGNQLALAAYPSYTGFDVSPHAVRLCEERFRGDDTKRFLLIDAYAGETAELTLSLDVVYHLVEDPVFEAYMQRLFDAARRFVIVYSSNTDVREEGQAAHVRHRVFTDWVERNRSDWKLAAHIPNRYPPHASGSSGSLADFYVYERALG